MSVDRDLFRRVMGQFATGVTIVTTRLGDHLHGSTANAFTSVSLEPLLVLVCLDKKGDTHDLVRQSGIYAVNILSEEQEELSRAFARKDPDNPHRLDSVPHRYAVTGAPIIEGCLAYLDCRVVDEVEAGDHTIFLGRVEEAAINADGRPLLFFRGRYCRLADEAPSPAVRG
ncbi:MAG TPA: flavin reductase family protein [Dehalococcoidia bacterium]|nr:flavin reductase family protein [Dehalococcoidia bacterium]